MPTKNMSAELWARKATARLKALGNKTIAIQSQNYFKPEEKVHFFGIRAAVMRAFAAEIYRSVAGAWSADEATTFCDILIKNHYLECKGLGILLLSRFKKEFTPELLQKSEAWLMKGWCSNWAMTDAISTLVLAPIFAKHPILLDRLDTWTSCDVLWVRRAAAVSLTPFARRGVHLDRAYRIAARLLDNPEDLMHKATGWLLREAGKTDPERLKLFLLSKGLKIPRTALRYAIERYAPEERRHLLENTKSPGGG